MIRKNKDADKNFTEDSAKWEAKSKKERVGEKKPQPPPLLTCWLDDTTMEAVASRLNDNPRGVLMPKDEFSHWWESMDQYHDRSGSDVSRWLSIWNGKMFALDRASGRRSYRIPVPRCSVTGGTVPETFPQFLTSDYIARGVVARFLLAMPTRNNPREWVEESIPKEVKAAVNDLFATLAALEAHKDENGEEWPVLLGLSPEAKKIFVAFHNECARRAFEADIRKKAQWSKLSEYSARLALVGQVLRDSTAKKISGEVMQAAVDLARWFGNETERIFALMAETPEQREQRELIEFIARRGGGVTERDVYTNYSPLKNKPIETKAALEKQVKAGRGEWLETRGERGPATRKFQLLPPVSASACFPISPSAVPKPADADTPTSPENEASGKRELAPEKESSAATASVQMMMTRQMEADLLKMGCSQAAINKMKPEEASEILGGKVGVPGDGGVMEI